MGTCASKEQEPQAPEETHVTWAAPALQAAMGPANAYCSRLGAQPATDPACWPDMGAPCAVPSWVWYPAPWSYTWAPFLNQLWVAHPPPAASAPSIWAWGVSHSDPLVRSQHLAPLAPEVFPYTEGPPPPYSSPPPPPSQDASAHCAQVGWKTPAKSAPPPEVGRPSRGASQLKTYPVLLSRCASRFSIWAPQPSSSPELHPLPPSPRADPQPEPCCPRSLGLPPRARRPLF